MIRILAAILFIVVLLFGLSPVSHSFAIAKQAQVAIEASDDTQTQTTRFGSLASILVTVVIVMAILVLNIFVICLKLKGLSDQKSRCGSNYGVSRHFEPDRYGLLPAMASMLMYDMLRRLETQQQAMIDVFHPEIPATDDLNDIWTM